MNTPATENSKPRIVGTALTTLVIISALATIVCAVIRCKHGANYLVGLPVYVLGLPFVLAVAFFIRYFFAGKSGQGRLNSQCLTVAVSLVVMIIFCDFYASKEQAIDAGNPHTTDNAKLVSYGLFTRQFALSYKGQTSRTVTVKRTIGKFIVSLPFTAEGGYFYGDKFTFNAFNIFGWEIER